MAEEKNIRAEYGGETARDEQAEGRRVRLGRPYRFEEKEYEEIDLSGLDGLTVRDAVDIQMQLFGEREIAAVVLCDTATAFYRALAARATGLPIELFKLMPRGGARKVALAVRSYLNGDDGKVKNHVLTFEKPYQYKGQTYTEVDLSGLADLNSMHMSAAENRLAREGFVVTETATNYLYACVLASMATGLPEEFFTALPLCELLKLKNEVNSEDFFE